MNVCKQFCFGALMVTAAAAFGQPVPPLDHITINDARIFNISDDGSVYDLVDGPVASAQLSLVQGPNGAIAGSILVQDDHLNTWGPVGVAGKLSLKGTLPLQLKLAGGGKGQAKVKITGSYDAPLKLMRVLVKVKTPEGLQFQWNDAFVPEHADLTGFTLSRTAVVSNAKGRISGQHTLNAPAFAAAINTTDSERPNSDFQFKGKGINLFGDHNSALGTFSVSSSKASLGYGTFFTAGSLVNITSDNLFPRNF